MQLERRQNGWRLCYVGTFEPRPKLGPEWKEQAVTTDKWDEIEAAATITRNDTLMMVYTTLGDEKHDAMLNWVRLEEALRKSGGNKQKASLVLGLSRQGLVKKLKRLGAYGVTRVSISLFPMR